MGEPGHHRVGILLDDADQHFQKPVNVFLNSRNAVPCIKAHIKSNLVVTAPSGMHLLAGISDPVDEIGLNKAVNIFIFRRNSKLAAMYIGKYTFKTVCYAPALIIRNNAAFCQHRNMSLGPFYINLKKPFVKAYRCIKIIHLLIGLFCKPSTPQLSHIDTSCSAMLLQ